MRTAIFDLDGTLADTSADLLAAANACFSTSPLDPVRDRLVAFHGGRAMLKLGFERLEIPAGDAEITRELEVFLRIYADGLHRETRLYDGVEAALDRLAEEGWALGVCTNKPIDLAVPLLESLGVAGRFRAVLGAGSLPVRKPDPAHLLETIAQAGGRRERAVLVGDTVTDRDAARNAGVPCVLVEFGPQGPEIAELEPDALLPHYDQLSDVLGRVVA